MEYQVVTEETYRELVTTVNVAIKAGWVPIGGIAITNEQTAQAMTRTTKKNTKEIPFTTEQVANLWNRTMRKSVMKIRVLSEKEHKRIKALSQKEYKTIKAWEKYFKLLNNSNFLINATSGWKPKIEWALRDQTMANLINGVYDND